MIADASVKDSTWYADHGFVPINHLVSASAAACERDPGAVREAYGLLLQSFARLPAAVGKPSPYAFGMTSLLGPVQYVIEACLEQGLLSRRLGIDEVFGPAEAILGSLTA